MEGKQFTIGDYVSEIGVLCHNDCGSIQCASSPGPTARIADIGFIN